MKNKFYLSIVILFVLGISLISMGIAFAADNIHPTLNIPGITVNGVLLTPSNGVYTLNTNGNANTHHAIQFSAGASASENLKVETVELKLVPTSGQVASLQDYYLKNYPAAYTTYFKDAVTGLKPFAYIKTNGTTIKVLDGAQKYLANIETDMNIPGNYPVGTYTLTGTIHDLALNSSVVSYTFKVVAGKVLGTESFHFTSLLKDGSSGNEVMELQKFLDGVGFNPGTVDGKFGIKTKTAIIQWQIAQGLKGDGSVGPLTRAALNK
jgi:hypothetical protein